MFGGVLYGHVSIGALRIQKRRVGVKGGFKASDVGAESNSSPLHKQYVSMCQ